MRSLSRTIGAALGGLIVLHADAALAGMAADLRSCLASDSAASIAACTRVLDSGRLVRGERYIGYFNRGWAHRNTGAFDAAIADFDAAADARPDYADTYYSRAIAHGDRGDTARSIADLDLYLTKKGRTWLAHFKRAEQFRRLSETELANAAIAKAEALGPRESKVAILKALLRSDAGEHEAANAELDKIIEAEPRNTTAHHARGLVYFRRQAYDEAAAAAQRAVAIEPDFAQAYALLGRIEAARNNPTAARVRFDQALAAPAKTVDALAAQDETRTQIASLEMPRRKLAAHDPMDCRRFISHIGKTVAVNCD